MQVKDFRDKHLGQIGFVIGSGPSLRHVNPEILKPYVTMSVNSSISKFINVADYFLADDIGASHWNYYKIQIGGNAGGFSGNGKGFPCFLFESKLKNTVRHINADRVVWFTHKTWYEPSKKKYYEDGLILTKDEPIIGARTTAGSAIHMLYIMGCDPIILLGCDCCYEGMNRYYWQFPGEPKCYRLNNEKVFSFPNKGNHKGKPVDSHSMDFLEYWEALSKSTKKMGVNIINASGGVLDSFPRQDLSEILDKFKDRIKK